MVTEMEELDPYKPTEGFKTLFDYIELCVSFWFVSLF